jgi:hypothetical protein
MAASCWRAASGVPRPRPIGPSFMCRQSAAARPAPVRVASEHGPLECARAAGPHAPAGTGARQFGSLLRKMLTGSDHGPLPGDIYP